MPQLSSSITPRPASGASKVANRGKILKAKEGFLPPLFNPVNPRFVPRTREVAHVHIMKGSGCSSSIGRTGGRQTVSLGSGCVYAGDFLQDFMSNLLSSSPPRPNNLYRGPNNRSWKFILRCAHSFMPAHLRGLKSCFFYFLLAEKDVLFCCKSQMSCNVSIF